jgi:Protein of unknown function (DUF2934)
VSFSHEKAVKPPSRYSLARSDLLIFEPRFPMKSITAPTVSKTTPPEPMLEHAIRLRAYELYAQRGMAEGKAVQDWLEAVAELLYSHSTTAADFNQELKRYKVN